MRGTRPIQVSPRGIYGDKVAKEQAFLQVFMPYFVGIILEELYSHSFIYPLINLFIYRRRCINLATESVVNFHP